jgi:uncharacterized repeat protein (TIGR01451 family)
MRARKLGVAGSVLAVLVIAAIGPGGAAAIVGPTDLVLTKDDSADPVVDETNFNYTIQVRNQGANDASGVTVTDTLPSRVSYRSSSSTVGSCTQANRTVTCTMGQVDVGTTATITIGVKASSAGTVNNTASLASIDDTVMANNEDTETTTITAKPKTSKPKKPKKTAPSCAAPTISGTAGNDVLIGTSGGDVIRSFAGNDRVFGGGGADLICTNFGADVVFGGAEGDVVAGGPGPDQLFGGTSGDILRGNVGRDRLRGQRGGDRLNGGRNRDNCKGGADPDVMRRCP